MTAARRPRFPLRFAIPLVLVVGLALRLTSPLADPPPSLSWSSGVYTDPASKTLPARFAIEKGDWSFETSPYLAVFPLANGIAWATWRVFGVGRLAHELPSVLAALGGLVIVVAALHRRRGGRAALYAAILGSVSFWLAMFARVPVVENFVAALLAGSCWFALRDRARDRVAAGALAAIAILFGKYHAAGFLPGLVAFVILEKRDPKAAVPLAAGGAAILVPWLFAVFLPQRSEIFAFVDHVARGMQGPPLILRSPIEGALGMFHAVRNAWVFHQAPVVGIVGGLFATATIAGADTLRRRVRDGTALFAFWFLGMWAYYALLSYQAPRYYVVLGLPLMAAAACQLAEWSEGEGARRRFATGAWGKIVAVGAIYFFGVVVVDLFREYLAVVMLHDRTQHVETVTSFFRLMTPVANTLTSPTLALRWAILPAALAGGALAAVHRSRRPRFPGRRAVLIAMVVAVAFDVARFATWAVERKHVLQEIREAIPGMIGPGAVLLGSFAPLVTLGTHVTAVSYLDPTRKEDVLARYGVTHLLLDDRQDPRSLQTIYPDLEARASFVQAWSFRARNVKQLRLYRIVGARYEPTPFEHAAQEVRDGNWSRALERFEEVRAASGESRELLFQEAACRYQLGDPHEATRLLLRAHALEPDDPQVLHNLALLSEAAGNEEGARRYLREALELDPHNEEILRRIRRSYAGSAP